MWTETTRRQYRREELRYASDMTDAEWALIEPHMPTQKVLGRPRKVQLREVVEALLYIADGVSVASAAARLSEAIFGAALLLRVAETRSMGADQFLSRANRPRARKPRSQPLGRSDR